MKRDRLGVNDRACALYDGGVGRQVSRIAIGDRPQALTVPTHDFGATTGYIWAEIDKEIGKCRVSHAHATLHKTRRRRNVVADIGAGRDVENYSGRGRQAPGESDLDG